MKALCLFIALISCASMGAINCLNDSIDPQIPDEYSFQITCEPYPAGFSNFLEPEMGLLSITFTDSLGLLTENIVTLDLFGVPEPIVDSVLQFTDPYEVTFEFEMDGGDVWDLYCFVAVPSTQVFITECDDVIYDAPIETGNIGNSFYGCDTYSFYGEWSICDGPEGATIGNNGTFTTNLYADSLGLYTVCFQSAATDSIYEFQVMVAENGCPDPNACNYTNEYDCDAGYCNYYCSECDNYLEGPIYLPDTLLDPCEGGTIQVVNGAVDAVIQSASDLNSLLLNIEHSYVGDLSISLTCPNGQSVEILPYLNLGSGNYLGDAQDYYDDVIGVTADYFFSEYSELGQIDEVEEYLTPPGGYQTSQSFSELIGCPVNGEWTLEICDHLLLDDGYLGGWGLFFDPDLLVPECANAQTTGCTDELACNYNEQATIDINNCIFAGCMDDSACNYDPLAGCDDGSCEFPGCMDPLACNYDSTAACDDGSCEYIDCVTFDYNLTVEYSCDTTYLSYSIANMNPNYISSVYTVPAANYNQPIEYGVTYDTTIIGGGLFAVELVLSVTDWQNGPQVAELGELIVLTTPEVPVIEVEGDLLVCQNCGDNFDFEWYSNGQLVSQATDFLGIEGEMYELCIHQSLDDIVCAECSEPILFNSMEDIADTPIDIYANGTQAPFLIVQTQQPVLLYNITGQLLSTNPANIGEIVSLSGFPPGIYIAKIGSQAYKVEVGF